MTKGVIFRSLSFCKIIEKYIRFIVGDRFI
jgi:hypothetical protein